jgi:diguanylate cyclase (GGDEF)-like protein
MDTASETTPRAAPRLPARAWLFLLSTYGIALAAAVAGLPLEPADDELRIVLVFAALAAVGQLFVVVTPRNQSYHVTPGIVLAAAILLPPPLVAVVVVVQHLPEWVRARYPWFIQAFNIANYTIGAVVAGAVFDAVAGAPSELIATKHHFFAAGLAAAVVFVLVTHALLAAALVTARGQSFLATGLFTFHSLTMDLGLSVLGVVVAALWEINAALIALALAPLLLLHRTLALPKLEAEARQDAKTGLYNARFFNDALDEAVGRLERGGERFSLLLADLDLLRTINNTYGHLAGDAVLTGVAHVFRDTLRPHDIAARFGGEEFCVLLPDTDPDDAREIAERIRLTVEAARFDVETATEPIGVTVSIGVAAAPSDAATARDILHLADVAAYRAKSEGRNRVATAGDALGAIAHVPPTPPELPDGVNVATLTAAGVVPVSGTSAPAPATALHAVGTREQAATTTQPPSPNFFALRPAVVALAVAVGAAGLAAGAAACLVPLCNDPIALLLLVGLVASGQALSVGVMEHGSISVSAIGSLAGVALLGPAAALPLAVTVCIVQWALQRTPFHKLLFNCGALTLSSLAASGVFAVLPQTRWILVLGGGVAGAVYYAVNVGLLASVIALETHEPWRAVLRARFAWLFVYYVVYGAVGAMVAVGYDVAGPLGMLVFVLPVALVRKAQLDYISHTEDSVRQLREAARTIEQQNESLKGANALLRERATEAMESLAAAVDARDAYTAGHSRRVQVIAVAIARQLGLDDATRSAVSYGALFHDVGKLAVPDSVLLKRGVLDDAEWELVREHPLEGERIIGHLGFLVDSTPMIRHHHERFDGTGYPDGLSGEEIPLGARIVLVADAFDSMMSARTYRAAVDVARARQTLLDGAGTQFCPACVAAFERALDAGELDGVLGLDAAA